VIGAGAAMNMGMPVRDAQPGRGDAQTAALTSAATSIASPLRVGEVIQVLRQRRHWSQRDLGREAGISASHVSDIERGRHTAELGTRKKLAIALGVPLTTLLEDDQAYQEETTSSGGENPTKHKSRG